MIKAIIILILLFFVLNLIWEFSHQSLYDWKKPPLKDTKEFKTKQLLKSSLGDVLYLALIFALISFLYKNISWMANPSPASFLLIALLGLTFSALIEVHSIPSKWSYLSTMPTFLGVGLTPLIQLATTGILSLLITNKIV